MPVFPPPGLTDLDPWLPPLGGQSIDSVTFTVVRFTEYEDGGPPTWEAMVHLEAVDVHWPGGAKPRTARIAYKFVDDPAYSGYPQWVEQALSLAATGVGVVRVGDRLGILATRRDGSTHWLFDGRPYGFEAIISEDAEDVILTCIGIEKSLWDTPAGGQTIRHGDKAYSPLAADYAQTSVPAVFNPNGEGNCTPSSPTNAFDYTLVGGSDTSRRYPMFLSKDLPDGPSLWTLPRAVAYLLYRHNPTEEFVVNPDRDKLDDTLIAKEPKDGIDFDPNDPDTYDEADVVVPTLPITSRPILPLVEGLIGDKGFSVDVRLKTPYEGSPPVHEIEVYHQQSTRIVDLYLQAQGEVPNVQRTNIGDCHLIRDISEGVKTWNVLGKLARYEVSVVLACGFKTSAADAATKAALAIFKSTRNPLFNTYKNFYRLYVFDECGEGHWQPLLPTKQTNIPSLDAVFGSPVDGLERYARRRRPALGDLITKGPDGQPARHELAYSTDYSGPSPGLWDGTGTWNEIQGGYDILKDRLGIWINVETPESWQVGQDAVLKGVTSQAVSDPTNPKFYLRLTCVIEADVVCGATSEARDTSILYDDVSRSVDASDRYVSEVIAAKSKYNPGTTEVVMRNDTDAAMAEAISLRDATDAGVLDGPVVIPWFTMNYDIGNRIRKIRGRELGLRTDGGGAEQSPVLPSIRSIHWNLRGDQSTSLSISDGQTLRTSYRRKIRTNYRSPGFRGS